MSEPVAVVVVTWNSAHEIEACLRSVRVEAPVELWVVDNGSADGTRERVRDRFPEAQLLESPVNVGFAAGCNLGVAHSSAPYVLFLNADAQLAPGYLRTLVAALTRDPAAASATGKLVYDEDGVQRIDSAGIVIHRHALRPMDRGYGEVDNGQFDTAENIFGPSGAAALYRRSALLAAGEGPFDAELFAYYEDVDLAWRLNRLGWRHLYEPNAVAFHKRRGADNKPTDIAARAFANRYVVWLKNESWREFLRYGWVAIPWELARLVRRAATRPRLLRGVGAAVGRAPGILRSRWRQE